MPIYEQCMHGQCMLLCELKIKFLSSIIIRFLIRYGYYTEFLFSLSRLSVDRSRSIVGAILSKVVLATFSTITSISKILWKSDPTPAKRPEPKPQLFAQASPLTCFKDHPRKGEKITLSLSVTLAAVTDSLGCILLLDTQALVVVRLWKIWQM
ncbi:hypothetical protein P3S67_005039 [Capsicum chacoense]